MNDSAHNKMPDSTAFTAQKWNKIADSWHSWMPRMRQWYAPATELMLQMARIRGGGHVLDIAAGDCDQTLDIANLVGPNGYVLAIDVAEELLRIGGEAALEAGIRNIETRVMDGANLDLPGDSFDAAICRFALMYFPDPVRGLEGIRRVLRPKGRVSLVVYGLNGSPEFSLAVSVVREQLGLPEAKAAAHSLGETAVLQQTLQNGGFVDVEIRSLDLLVQMKSAEECVHYLQATSPTLSELTSSLTSVEQKELWEEVQRALRVFEVEQGLEINHKVVIAAGSSA
jgi:ubiquinone/menaquinone biosynthesis C-methylase UbiE